MASAADQWAALSHPVSQLADVLLLPLFRARLGEEVQWFSSRRCHEGNGGTGLGQAALLQSNTFKESVSPLLAVQRYAGEQINWLSCAGSLRSALPIKLRYPHCFTRLIAQLIANEESWIATQVNGDAVNVRVASWSLKPITQRMNELLWALVNRHSGKLSDDKGGQAFDIEHTGFRYQRTAVIDMN